MIFKTIFAIFFSLLSLYAKSDIDKKIYYSKKELQRKEKNISGLNTKLDKIAKEIRKNQNELQKIEKKLTELTKELKEKEEFYKESKKRLQDIQKSEKELIKKQESLKEQLTLLIAKYFSKSLISQNLDNKNLEDVINEELLKSIQKSEKNKILKIGSIYNSTKKLLEKEQTKISELQKEIESLDKKRKELISLKNKKEKSLKSLKKKKKDYKKALDTLLREQKSLRATLNRLQILKEEKSKVAKKSEQNSVKVRNLGSSYQSVKTIRYRGPKTIPPLDKFVITKRYGKYVDPIYKIKIFNESIELKPLEPNAKVKNVLNGKVILAKKTPHLNNVIIIKHKGGLYTIYAHIDKIAPTIKKGKKVKKGYVIGRVNNKLTFEVTKNRYHINPLELIRVK